MYSMIHFGRTYALYSQYYTYALYSHYYTRMTRTQNSSTYMHLQSNRPVLLGPTVEVGPGSVSPGHARLEGHYTLTHAICMMARAGRGGPVNP